MKRIIFYDSMHYPYPQHEDYYRYINEIRRNESEGNETENNSEERNETVSDHDKVFSRENECTLMDEYRAYILSLQKLFSSLPFVRQIYLCNSITFNALHPWSDIDICIICRRGYLWAARIWSVIFFLYYKIKRSGWKSGDHSKKFCLSFSIDESAADLYPIRNSEGDRYLVYRLAHTVLLYSDDTLSDSFLWQANKKLLSFLPNHPQRQTINIGIEVFRGNAKIKNVIEKVTQTWIGRCVIFLIKQSRKQRIYYKKNKLSVNVQRYIIISNTILKFYDDKRHTIQHKIRTMLSKW